MNKKQKTYLLFIAVAIVWGAIGYQLYMYFNPSIPEFTNASNTVYIPQKTKRVKKTTIQPDYRDPFLGKIYRKKKKVVKKTVTEPKPIVNFPPIQYKGVIEGKEQRFIIAINGMQEVFQKGQEIQQIKLIRATSDEVLLQYQGERKKYVRDQ